MNSFKSKVPYLRDVFLAYLIEGAERTDGDGYPIIPKQFCFDQFPTKIVQWDRHSLVKEPGKATMSFYCGDLYFQPVLSDPIRYVEKLKTYEAVVGMDCSPFDNMPLVVQKHQIWLNLAITYFYGSRGIKVLPNVRLGDAFTCDSLDAYPKGTIIAIGTNGFTKRLSNRQLFMEQVSKIVETLKPGGIAVYGPVDDSIFVLPRLMGIEIRSYDSFMHEKYLMSKEGGASNERQ